MSPTCAGCNKKIPKREFLTCSYCQKNYDLECANVSSQRFYNTMTLEHKQRWKCQACYCKMPKIGNENTPVRSKDCNNIVEEQCKSPEVNNITVRKCSVVQRNDSLCSVNSENTTFLGDDTVNNMRITNRPELTLQSVSEVISQKLAENNINVISQLRNIIQEEVKQAIELLKKESKQQINNLSEQNRNRILEIQEINTKIDNLQKENCLLKKQLEELGTKTILCKENKYPENDSKKIVLYGLAEYYMEPENYLLDRIHGLFWDLMGVDLTGYIEDISRIGRYNKNGNRPLVIEFISRRIVKQIIENSYSLKRSGLSVSEFLDKTTLLRRKAMREEMFLARQRGLHAVLRNNQLYVDGKIFNFNQNPNAETLINTSMNKENQGKLTESTPNPRNSFDNNYSFRKQRFN
ncbi:unnamed protein product [Chilo suppressalis]|uniref:Zinc finger PHD-type domain-containing protein n=1 Tax=Chilo suppressalis TaxID=168631 RepID=A0ABN8B328_CHISP|nr:unnamed protein product [Chilo suppressalis]